nr:MAG: ORF1 [TTV-like mini virus]UGV34672.1 MAG: ORF1 [TTV-like mini virus]UGV34830.1 MAG: ORF1 [TTV-like mini virus]
MPYYWRRWPYRRRRRIWRRRARTPFRRRRYWRRRHWVRTIKRKLKKITVKEWQPTKIRKLKVTGKYPLFEGTNERLGNNNTQYIDSIAPYLFPSGGLYSITVFTLKGLYELHQKARNWWTTTNCNLPLIKYTGCKITLYRNIDVDYVTVYSRCGALKATEDLYRSCQPSVLLLNKHKKVVTCKKNNNKRKISKTIKIPPPSLMQSKWYFQKDFANYPLVMLLTSALSLDRYYSASDSISSTLGFTSLDTTVFQYSDFKSQNLTTPYKPNDAYWLGTWTNHTVTDFASVQIQHLILLGNTKDYTPGQPLGDNYKTTINQRTHWGNPFYGPYLEPEPRKIIMITNLDQIRNATSKTTTLQSLGFSLLPEDKHILTYCRYNPQADKSAHNALYISNVTTNRSKWNAPTKPELSTSGLPIWLLTFGFHDWLLKSEAVRGLDQDYVYVLYSDYIQPHLTHYVPLDFNFQHGRSPFELDDHIRPYDKITWYPKTAFQHSVFAQIISTGPGTVKLPNRVSVEASCKYTFYFKLGGCPPPMDDVCDPQNQPDFPTPSNIISPTLLQNPEMPIQYYIQAFDQRRGLLTEKAAKRIKKDYETKETLFQPTGTTALDVKYQTPETTSTEESETEEKEPETLQISLQRHRRKQRKLQQRIMELLRLAQNLESLTAK